MIVRIRNFMYASGQSFPRLSGRKTGFRVPGSRHTEKKGYKNGNFDGRMVYMNATVEIDKAGRIVVPKKLRDDMHLVPGTRLRIERSGDRLVFEQDYAEPQLINKDGMWVVSGGPITEVDVSELIRQGYAERMERILEGSGLE